MPAETSRLITQQGDRRVWLVTLQQDEPFKSPCPGEEFAALVAVYDSTVTHDNRNQISDALIEQGCRYGVCFGYECSLWDDALDWAFMVSDPDCNPPDDRFVMTSWHEDEPLEDVIFFFLQATACGDFTPQNFIVLMIGDGPAEEIAAAVRSELADF